MNVLCKHCNLIKPEYSFYSLKKDNKSGKKKEDICIL